jgi:hypothetical protein
MPEEALSKREWRQHGYSLADVTLQPCLCAAAVVPHLSNDEKTRTLEWLRRTNGPRSGDRRWPHRYGEAVKILAEPQA